MKRWFTILAALALTVLCVVLLPTEAKAASSSDLTFTLNSDGESYSVTDCNDSASGSLIIPATYNGKPVTGIGDKAFYNCAELTGVTIPNSVTKIGYATFSGCSKMESLTIPFVGSSKKTATDTYQYPLGYIFGEYSYTGGVAAKQYYFGSSTNSTTYATYYIPATLKSVTVTGGNILYGAFYNCSGLTSITIPASVTSIGDSAFYNCSNLTGITIPDGVTSIGRYAFNDCSSLTSITIPDSVTSLGDYVFSGCSGLTAVYITDLEAWCKISLSSASSNPLYHAKKLYLNEKLITKLEIPSSITSISQYAFYNCTELTSVTIPDSVTKIGYAAFSGCIKLESLTIPFVGGSKKAATDTYQYPLGYIFGEYSYTGGVAAKQYYFGSSTNSTTYTTYYIPATLKSVTVTGGNILYGAFYNCSGLTSITIPDSVTSIGESAFYNCSSLTGITIPDGVTSIGRYAFNNCSKLSSITIPDSVTSLGDYAFSGCSGLTAVYITDLEVWCKISLPTASSNPLYYAKKLYLNGKLITKLEIPSSITSISQYAFYNCTELTSVTIPDSVTKIGYAAFSGCIKLESLTIPFVGGSKKAATDTYQYPLGYIFGEYSYTGGVAAKQYYFGSSTNSTTYTTYYIPTTLKSVTVTGGNILYGAFYNCSGLTSITIPDSVTSIDRYAIQGCSNLKYNIYDNGQYLGSINNPYQILIAAASTSITECTIHNNTKGIHYGAFSDCSALTSVTIPNSIVNIGDYAFKGCTRLPSVTIPEGITSIGAYVYSDCPCLTTITIPNSVTSIGSHAFSGCAGLTSIVIPDGITSIGYYAFSVCNGLTSIAIPDSVTSIDKGAFSWCTSLTSVKIPESVTSIGDSVFYNCTSLTSVTIPNSVTSIGDYTFYNCTSLTSITIPEGVTSIEESAFRGCTGLTQVAIPNGVIRVGQNAFYGCSRLASVAIPDSITNIESYAFYNCAGLISVTYCGTQEQQEQLVIGSANTYLTKAEWNYHNWSGGDCTTLQTCTFCGEAGGEYQHAWIEASCTNKQFCFVCGETVGDFGHIWTDATCVALKTCTTCGTTTGDYAPHTYDNDADAFCSVCNHQRVLEEATLKFYSSKPSLSFQDYIGMQILIRNSDVSKYDKVYVIAVQETPNGPVETTLKGIPYYGSYQVFDQQIVSWSMTEEVTMTLYGEIDGVVYKGASFTASVKSLAMDMLKKYANDTIRTRMLVDMLNYGAAVQTRFDYNADKLANADLGEFADKGTTEIPALSATNIITGTGKVTVSTHNISLQAKVEIQMLFKKNVSAYTAKAFVNGKEVTVVMDRETYADRGYTVLRVPIAATQMRETFTIALYDANGNPVTQIYEVSAEGYVNARQSSDKNAMDIAMMRYGDSVKAYATK